MYIVLANRCRAICDSVNCLPRLDKLPKHLLRQETSRFQNQRTASSTVRNALQSFHLNELPEQNFGPITFRPITVIGQQFRASRVHNAGTARAVEISLQKLFPYHLI